jgi:hypothetical protein
MDPPSVPIAEGDASVLGAAIDGAAAGDDSAAGEDSPAGACASAGIASAPTNNAAVSMETVRFMSFSFSVPGDPSTDRRV